MTEFVLYLVVMQLHGSPAIQKVASYPDYAACTAAAKEAAIIPANGGGPAVTFICVKTYK